jgi:hypothetical protein
MNRCAAGVPPLTKVGRTTKAAVNKTLRFKNFSGDVLVMEAEKGKALLLVSHADLHVPNFGPADYGVEVS